MNKKNIFLIGFMGCGKSTVAGFLNRSFGMDVVEMDQVIEERAGMSITDIFASCGEEHFRDLETQLVAEMQQHRDKVVSCGGGTPMRSVNVENMKKSGTVVYLTAKPETIYERVKDNHDRPVLENNKSVAYITELMEQRSGAYEAAADIKIATDGKSGEAICRELLEQLDETNL